MVDTDGIVLPGLIDLHGHPDFNIFAPWEPPTLFINRMQWRNSDLYHSLLRDRWDALEELGLADGAARYAEVRALVGGTTAIQGASPRFPTEEALVRNVDKRIFGSQIGRSMVDLDERSLGDILEQIVAGDVRAFYVHVAEGRKDNEASHNEFAKLADLGGLTDATVVIHGTALSRVELQHVKDAGAKLVWSPQSNLRLYGETTSIADAMDLEIPVALGADWLPSGSRSLLDEMRVARHEAASQGAPITDRQLVRMVTRDAASIAGLASDLGFLMEGRTADVLVLERHAEDPWESVLAADPSWVELVTIAGDLAYGRRDWIGATGCSGAGGAGGERDRLGEADGPGHLIRGCAARSAAASRGSSGPADLWVPEPRAHLRVTELASDLSRRDRLPIGDDPRPSTFTRRRGR